MSGTAARSSRGYPPPSSRSAVPRTVLLAGCIAGALGAGVFAIWYWRRRSAARSFQPSSPLSLTQPTRPPPHYEQRVNTLIDHMAATGELTAINIQQHRSHLQWLEEHSTAMDVSAADCLSAVKLLTTYHTLRNLHIAQSFDPSNAASVAALREWEVEQTSDLERAWNILQSQPIAAAVSAVSASSLPSLSSLSSPSSATSAVAAYSSVPLLCLELAQRLKRADRLSSAYALLMATPVGVMSEEQLIATFMTAPLLGKWKDVRSLGQQLIAIKGPNTMNEFHEAAMSDVAFMDYSLLFDKSVEWQRASVRRTSAGELQFVKYDVDRVVVSHDTSHSPIDALNAMLQSMAAGQKDARTIHPPAGSFPLQVTGAIARMQSPFIVELPCVGRYEDGSMSLHAAATLQQDEQHSGSSSELSMVEVSIEAVRESSTESGSRWRGRYAIKEYEVSANRGKGPLRLMHQFHLLLDMSVSGGGEIVGR